MNRVVVMISMLTLVYRCIAGQSQPVELGKGLSDIRLRDPFILPVAENEKYYMYGTGWNLGSGPGFMVYRSGDLITWHGPTAAFRRPEGFWPDRDYWAPEVHQYKGRYYLFGSFKADGKCRSTQVLVSDTPNGPFAPLTDEPITPHDWECLDGTLYVDEAGDPWMVFCHEWVQVADGEMCAMRLSPDLKRAVGEPVQLFTASQPKWAREIGPGNRRGYVTDGPFLYRNSKGTLLMLWSSFGEGGYKTAVARSNSGEITGPWVHEDKPIFENDGGHPMLFRTFEGQLVMAIHQPNGGRKERPRLFFVTENGDSLAIKPFGRTGSWGDQGDGTFKNPMLNADYPDVDIERVGDTYYLITSTNHYAPGMTICESKDLINWTLIGHVWEKLTWDPKYNWDRMAGYGHGIWAGDLAYHEKRWYCYQIDTSNGLYVSTAEKITGPWTEPLCMLKKQKWTDPAVFWDEDEHQAYLVCNFGNNPEFNGNETRMFKMRWDGLKLLDEGKAIYGGPGTEAAKIYKVDGYYYLFMAEWRDNDRKQIVLRGKSLYGPFERKVVMEKSRPEERSVCQGALVQAVDGSWWLSHQLVQARGVRTGDMPGPTTGESYEGRSQWLVPVQWQEGWPVVGADPDGNGVGNTVLQARMPIDGLAVRGPQTDDDFDGTTLGPQWQWNHSPRDSHWSLSERPGWLRLKAGVPINDGGFWNAANTISQRLMGKHGGTVTAKVDISGVRPGQQAGLCHHSGQYVLLGVAVADDGRRHLVFNREGNVTQGPLTAADVLYLRTDMHGSTATFSYSMDGKHWQSFGEQFPIKFGRWRGDRIGFYCWNDKQEAGHIDIDWFAYDYDGPKGRR